MKCIIDGLYIGYYTQIDMMSSNSFDRKIALVILSMTVTGVNRFDCGVKV